MNLSYEQYREIRPQSIEVSIAEDGSTHVTAQLTEEQMKLLHELPEPRHFSINGKDVE